LLSIDFSIVNTALPSIQKDLGTGLVDLRWVIALFAITLCSFMTGLGRVGDLIGRKRVLLASMVLFAAASVLAGLATRIEWLIAARGFQGLSVAALFPTSLAVVTDLFPEEKRMKAVGIWAASNAGGLATGPPLGGLIVSVSSWRWIFLMNVPFTIISIAICAIALKSDRSSGIARARDWWAIPLLALAIGALITAILEEPVWGIRATKTWGLFAVGVAALVAFYFYEDRKREPLVDVRFFSNRQYLAASLVTFLNGFYMYALFFYVPLFLFKVWGASMADIGFLMLPITASILVTSRAIETFTRWFGVARVAPIGIALMAAAAVMQYFFVASTPAWTLVGTFIVFGIGWGLSYTNTTTLALSAVPKIHSGVASGLFFTIRNFAGALGLAISGAIFDFLHGRYRTEGESTPQSFVDGFHGVAVLLMITCLFTFVVFVAARPHRRMEAA